MEHINTMSHLREGIHLRSYAQNNPLREYKNEGYALFDEFHQYFVSDRSARLFDVGIDLLGVITGVALLYEIKNIIKKP